MTDLTVMAAIRRQADLAAIGEDKRYTGTNYDLRWLRCAAKSATCGKKIS